MKTFKTHAFRLSALSLGLLIAGGSAIAGDSNPAATFTLKAAPDAAHPHTVLVKLNAQGEWSEVQDANVKMRVAYTYQWSQQPNAGKSNWARIYFGEAKIPKGDTSYYNPAQMFDLTSAQVLAPSGTLAANLPFSMLVPDGIPGTNIAAYCGMEKTSQLAKGRKLHELLEKGFTVNLNTQLRLAGFYDLGGGPNTSRPVSAHQYHMETTAPLNIQCMGNPEIAAKVAPLSPSESGMAMDNIKTPFVVNSVQLETLHGLASKACPVEVAIKATIKGTGGGEVKYWLEEVGGNNAVQALTTSLPGKAGEPNIRVLMQNVTLKPGPQDQALPSPGIDTLKLNTHGTPVKRSYRLHVIAPNKMQSEKLDVAVNCTSTLNAGLGGNGDVKMAPQAQPDPQPKPAVVLQAAPVQPVEPPKPRQVVFTSPIEAPKPAVRLMAAPVNPAKPARVGRQTP